MSQRLVSDRGLRRMTIAIARIVELEQWAYVHVDICTMRNFW
jgi:hypothetical protein